VGTERSRRPTTGDIRVEAETDDASEDGSTTMAGDRQHRERVSGLFEPGCDFSVAGDGNEMDPVEST
jgi:hypothetical protein